MAEERIQRRLAAILAADVVGYSRLMGEDETGTRSRFNNQLNEIFRSTSGYGLAFAAPTRVALTLPWKYFPASPNSAEV